MHSTINLGPLDSMFSFFSHLIKAVLPIVLMVGNEVYQQTFTGNKEVYVKSQQTFWEALRSMFWSPFIGKTTPDGRMIKPLEQMPAPIENPIVMHRQLITKMGDTIQIPTIRQLLNMPKISEETLEDEEEEMKVNHCEVPVDVLRHAAKPRDGKMMSQTTKLLDLVNAARPGLKDHYARSMEYLGASYALYYGYSYNILKGNWFSGHSYIQTISHPHIYAVGQSGGKVAYDTGNPSTAGYETDVANAITNLGSSDVISAGTLRALKSQPQIRRIKPLVMKNGRKLRLLILHPFQLATLEDDPEFRQEKSRILADSMAKDNPLLYAAEYIHDGWAIFQSDTAVFPCRVNSSLPEFGPANINLSTFAGNLNSFESYTSDTKFAGFILGQNAVMMAVASAFQFIPRIPKDYEHLLGLAYEVITGFSRGDSWNRDDGTLGDTIINDGSALLLSYAPQPDLT